ncbi:ABC transporter ATP-binding protein [Paenibacillus barcinonensis]|uniref:ABC transporter ATP-binding protein n=1 Tax=Paenibacillus barcinonensis TaxID=198119 RepID=A0A2V4VXU9_PAEBA|nr:ABC transporter ATP-binding protein [Paenibacillus barcinonensis]PYE52595.1 ATP-binding cassette subfamily C protein [Paenibacillus barcinonensis]QKS59256.1 ABC transporter ATP-binding protein [Paenibacillus barcinonensis]
MKSELHYFMRKLHHTTGPVLYWNVLGMVCIGLMEGIGIYMLVPMLSLIGIFDMGSSGIHLPWLSNFLHQFSQHNQLMLVLFTFVLIVSGQAWMQRLQTMRNVRIQQQFIRTLRMEAYSAILMAKWSFFLQKRKSDFNHILTTELARVSQGTSILLQMAASLVFTAIQIGLAFWLSARLTALVLVCGLVLFFLLRTFVKRAKRIGDQTTEFSQAYYNGITEHFNGIKDIKSNMLEHSHIHWFDRMCRQIERNVVQFSQLNTGTQLIHRVSAAFIIAAFIYLSLRVMSVPPASLLLIILIFSRLWPRFTAIQSNLEYISSMLPAFRIVRELQVQTENSREISEGNAEEPQSAATSAYAVEPMDFKESIRCQDIYYRYEGNDSYSLFNVCASIPAKSMTAIVGKSGAGKSTFIDLIMGLMRPESGSIQIDGKPLTEERLLSWRSSIGYVSQDPFLFHTSIRENLRLVDPDASEEQMWRALQFSASALFVRRLPQGMDTIIGDRGLRLSGGERQRLVLARAMLRNPSVLVLDEATSALDSENEQYIHEALERLKGHVTIIVIAHRLSTIRTADRVIVLEEGRVIQEGGYQQLSADPVGTFSRLLNMQAGAAGQ